MLTEKSHLTFFSLTPSHYMINIMITFKYKNSINIFMHKMSNLVKSVATASLDSL